MPNKEEFVIIIKSSKAQKIKYIFLDYHHGRPTQYKSVWTSPASIELNLYKEMHEQEYMDNEGKYGFNIELSKNKKIEKLGRDIQTDELYIAKFDIPGEHGYPVNHKGKQSDRPSEYVLEKINEGKGLSPRDLRLIKKGQSL